MRHIWDAKVPMRDGVNLSADIYLPDYEGEYPTVVIGTPYDNTMKSHVDMAIFFVQHGYSFVVYDVRGRHDSEGDFYPFFNEGKDGYDIVEWVAAQPWSTGKIGMMGGSYRGWIQWATAKERPPHLTTMVPTATGGKWLQEFPFFNGVPCLWMFAWMNFVGGKTNQNTASYSVDWEKVFKTLPLSELPKALGREVPAWEEWMSHPDLDEFWKAISFRGEDFKGIEIPVLHITGYYDGDQPGALHYYKGAVEHGPCPDQQYMLMGPWDHAGTRFPKRVLGGVDFTTESLMEMRKVHLEWFNHWLKGEDNQVKNWPITKYYLMGKNKWVESDKHWKLTPEGSVWNLTSGGNANTLQGDGVLTKDEVEDSSDTYIYNPLNPVMPSTGYDFYGSASDNPLDQRYLLRRDDFLVYTSAPLKSIESIVGPPTVELFISSDCPDTDFFVSLHDVHPDGRSIMISRGLLRARYRDGLDRQVLMKEGDVYKLSIPMDSTGVVLSPGHRLRLTVTSSEFPRYARNNNTGKPFYTDEEVRNASNSVYHGKKYLSRVILP